MMKKILLFVIILLNLNNTSVIKAQNNSIKANIFSPLVRTGSFFFERGLSNNTSFQLGFYYTAFNVNDSKWRGFGITPEFRYYPSEEGLNGFYAAPFIRFQSLKASSEYEDQVYDSNGLIIGTTTNESSATLSTFGGGVLIGRQWIFGEHFSFDTFIGPCFNLGSIKEEDENSRVTFDPGSFSGFGLRFGVTIGFAF